MALGAKALLNRFSRNFSGIKHRKPVLINARQDLLLIEIG